MRWTIGILLFSFGLIALATPLSGPHQYDLRVDGLACPFCAYGIEKRLRRIEGVDKITSDVKSGTVTVTMDDGKTLDETSAARAVKEAGFTLRGFQEVPQATEKSTEADGKRK